MWRVGPMGTIQDLGARIQAIAAPIVRALHLELVEVICQGRGSGLVVRVVVDKDGGISLGDCETVHHSLSRALDVADPIPHAYRLEVSSPGLDRPLRQRHDYERSLGKLVRVRLREPEQGQWVLIGRLTAVGQDGITLLTRGKRGQGIQQDIPWPCIRDTKLEIEF
ncbi:MAG: ribosome maturation factor RimP [Nitrospirae bacterium]|nr:MAG: ribosome maturation factor RimP [Nitrospirota bacterium]